MNNSCPPLNGLTEVQRSTLLLVHKDGRYLYPSRSRFDADHRWLVGAPLTALYAEWKALNKSLVKGEPRCRLSLPLDSAQRIRFARQVLGLFTKLNGVCTASSIPEWSKRVAQCRSFVPKTDLPFCRDLMHHLMGPAPALMSLVPNHGPGAVATGERGIDKSIFSRMYAQLLPHGGVDLLHLNDNHWWREPYCLEYLTHPITKVIEVEKDIMRRRIISEEPLEMQFLQQGVARHIMRTVSRSQPTIRFTDQLPNRLFARQQFSYATLDMSDASDLVSRRQVWQLMPPEWRRLLFALRSHFGLTADGLVPLRCFAPMGSALCFPIESVVFYVLTCAALRRRGLSTLDRRRLVHVYGDDIIVPREHATFVMRYLSEIGFKPNVDKCCIHTPFRESCGAEYWNGDDISVIRPKVFDLTPGSISLPMVGHINRLYDTGYESAAAFLAARYKNIIALGENAPYGNPALPWAKPGRVRWYEPLQRLEQQCHFAVARKGKQTEHTGYRMLFMHLTNGWRSDMDPAPYLTIKRGWAPILPSG